MLLHDMGEGLADNRPEAGASGSEWRTPPLWGIGLTETVNGHTRFLHDGRARGLLEAVLWHGGEAATARQKVVDLPTEEREALLAFLRPPKELARQAAGAKDRTHGNWAHAQHRGGLGAEHGRA